MSDDIPDDGGDAALAAEYVLGLLNAEETRAVDARIAREPALRDLVASWTESLSSLADAIPPVPAPAGVEAAVMRRLFPEEKTSWLRRLGLIPALLGGLVAALAVLWTIDVGGLRTGPAGPTYEARIAAEDASLVVLARYEPDDGVLVVERSAGGIAEGRAQELWIVIGDAAPLSLGLLPEAGETTVALEPSLVQGLNGALLAISDEAPGGAPEGTPHGPLLATGVITEL